MYSKTYELEFQLVEKELEKVNKQLMELKNKEHELNIKQTGLLKEKCKENIGRCFEQYKMGELISYCKIVDIDNGVCINFNEYQYPSIWFKYPYDNSNLTPIPFYEANLFSGVWGEGNDCLGSVKGIVYKEIPQDEYFEKFNEVNLEWVKNHKNT